MEPTCDGYDYNIMLNMCIECEIFSVNNIVCTNIYLKMTTFFKSSNKYHKYMDKLFVFKTMIGTLKIN